ncbi:Ycf66 family protein [Mastigocladopsis repens]|uniref:Ycf66 family protein n=1 Tax=Mastigocladopsis repens TaxID=221287 RepID=UPI0003775103|nr:Ycf66 family protein [Mastigocladopsis repens]
MLNFGANSASISAIFLALFGLLLVPLGLSFRRPFRIWNLFQDILLALVCLLCSFILIYQGWRLDPILQFGQILLIVSVIYLNIKDIFSHIRIVVQKRDR